MWHLTSVFDPCGSGTALSVVGSTVPTGVKSSHVAHSIREKSLNVQVAGSNPEDRLSDDLNSTGSIVFEWRSDRKGFSFYDTNWILVFHLWIFFIIWKISTWIVRWRRLFLQWFCSPIWKVMVREKVKAPTAAAAWSLTVVREVVGSIPHWLLVGFFINTRDYISKPVRMNPGLHLLVETSIHSFFSLCFCRWRGRRSYWANISRRLRWKWTRPFCRSRSEASS